MAVVVEVSSDSSSEDEFVLNYLARKYRRRVSIRNDQFLWEDVDFRFRFRISKETALFIADMIKDKIKPHSSKNKAIHPPEQLLIALRFYATGSFQQAVGDIVGVHKGTVCKIIKRVSIALAEMTSQFINMPTSSEYDQVVHDFYNIAEFPNVIGAIDCTHIQIQSLGGENGAFYKNRKGQFSYNVQTVCDAKLRIRDIVCRWPGSVHDSTIFDHSNLKNRFMMGEFGNKHLLGDRGYAIAPYLLTPFANPSTSAERKYNRCHDVTRNPVERSYGVWKRRFPCVGSKLRLQKDRIEPVIIATAILHNICIQRNEIEVEPEISVDLEQIEEISNNSSEAGRNTRQNLVQNYFSRM